MINIKKGKKAINDDLRREFIKSSEDSFSDILPS